MWIYGEFETIARIFERFDFLINGGSVASVSYTLKTLPFMGGESNLRGMEFQSSTVSTGWNFEARLSLLGVHLKLLALLYWISACGSCVFP